MQIVLGFSPLEFNKQANKKIKWYLTGKDSCHLGLVLNSISDTLKASV